MWLMDFISFCEDRVVVEMVERVYAFAIWLKLETFS